MLRQVTNHRVLKVLPKGPILFGAEYGEIQAYGSSQNQRRFCCQEIKRRLASP
jgi:hypothetical protein